MGFPDTGQHLNIPAEEYHALEAASCSGLKLMNRSPAHYWQSRKNPAVQTPAMAMGEMLHTAILEPDRFKDVYVAGPEVMRSTNEWKAFVASLGPKQKPVRLVDWQTCQGMMWGVMGHIAARALVGVTSPTEVSLVLRDQEFGVLKKARLDKLILRPDQDRVQVIDIKKCQNAGQTAFAKQMDDYGYAMQAAWYTDLAGEIYPGAIIEFSFIAVEEEPPHGVGVYRLCDSDLELARKVNKAALGMYAWCTKRQCWPCSAPGEYTQAVQEITLPAWAQKKMEVLT